MIKRILVFVLFGFLVVALLLFFAGIRENSFNDESLKVFIKALTRRYRNWNFKIPNIPTIDLEGVIKSASASRILEYLIQLYWSIIVFFNFVIKILNVIVMLINTIISIFGFIVSFIGAVKDWLSVLGVTNSLVLTSA